MAGERRPNVLSDADYQRLVALLGATAKGRSFLAELGRQARAEDTRALFAALAAIQSSLAVVREQLRPEVLAGELRRIAAALRGELERAGGVETGGGKGLAGGLAGTCAELSALAEALSGGAPAALPQARAAGSETKGAEG